VIRAERIEVGEEPVDLTEGSGTSGVTVQYLFNASSKATVLLGGDESGENAIPIDPGEPGPSNLALNSTDHLHVRSRKGTAALDVVLGWA
jgi:hypothetical protein